MAGLLSSLRLGDFAFNSVAPFAHPKLPLVHGWVLAGESARIWECGDVSPLFPTATGRRVPKRGHARARQIPGAVRRGIFAGPQIKTLTRPTATLSHPMGEGHHSRRGGIVGGAGVLTSRLVSSLAAPSPDFAPERSLIHWGRRFYTGASPRTSPSSPSSHDKQSNALLGFSTPRPPATPTCQPAMPPARPATPCCR